ncbi:uncharacterized protein EV420DRAFT_1616583 [Desarmillaria tabescens]|uniref:Uncharacterized protein n=1 Tax=Armillaria tabescens TaxID=1929756 RepID=A0AA39NRE3_ARMTA|nr:uncharacterized protein EV420DRAFT_1616583 [Desarmillaria tabescens]KAK0470469.1 hypothetical protein EV420DRAFT_1616583 [Desarmillaria tabescens]
MHLIWENLLKNLVLHWTGKFKGLDEGTESYELDKSIWKAIGEATAKAGSTVPSAYGARVPNIAGDGVYISAEMWSFWVLYLGPVLLQRCFKAECYYNHFIRLVQLLNVCLQFEILHTEIEYIWTGFASWVEDYEKIYYQYNVDRLSTCPLTIHVLLHIADSISATGPVWCYWAFPMEWYCGALQPAIHSHRYPFASLAWHVLEDAQLTQIKAYYDVAEKLSLWHSQHAPMESTADPTCQLLPPKASEWPSASSLTALQGALVTRLKCPLGTVKRHLQQANVMEWGQVQCIDLDAGDTMRASELGVVHDDSRDASWVQPESSFIMASIRSCKCIESEKIDGLDIHFYTALGQQHVTDITTVQCLVGRVPCGQTKWAIMDRSGSLARAVYSEDDRDLD